MTNIFTHHKKQVKKNTLKLNYEEYFNVKLKMIRNYDESGSKTKDSFTLLRVSISFFVALWSSFKAEMRDNYYRRRPS